MQPGFTWPPLSAAADGATIATLHLFSQVVGKVPTALVPWRNHGWHLTLHLTPRGFRTEPIHAAAGPFELMLDLVDGTFLLEQEGERLTLPLAGRSVAAFYHDVAATLARAGHDVTIDGAPNEIDPAIPFAQDDKARDYDPTSAGRLLGALLSADRVFRLFRSGFLGKVSPVHFYWGSFDLAVTRFSGRPAPLHPGGIPNLPDAVTREAYSHEVSSAGFWPGSAGAVSEPIFYSYAYPAPPRFAEAPVEPEAARYDPGFAEFILDYEAVRQSDKPDAALLAFLESTYAAAAELGRWDRAALECVRGKPHVPRPVQPPRQEPGSGSMAQ
jgi:hypothetical protein